MNLFLLNKILIDVIIFFSNRIQICSEEYLGMLHQLVLISDGSIHLLALKMQYNYTSIHSDMLLCQLVSNILAKNKVVYVDGNFLRTPLYPTLHYCSECKRVEISAPTTPFVCVCIFHFEGRLSKHYNIYCSFKQVSICWELILYNKQWAILNQKGTRKSEKFRFLK